TRAPRTGNLSEGRCHPGVCRCTRIRGMLRWVGVDPAVPDRTEPPAMLLTRDEVRDLDRRAVEEFGVPGVVLMENAGRGAAELLLSLGVTGSVVVCCGRGNNGGDGFVIARHLDLRGVDVKVLLFEPPDGLKGDALV